MIVRRLCLPVSLRLQSLAPKSANCRHQIIVANKAISSKFQFDENAETDLLLVRLLDLRIADIIVGLQSLRQESGLNQMKCAW